MERIKGFLKRAISFALAASMLLGNIPVGVFAQEEAEAVEVVACVHTYENGICTLCNAFEPVMYEAENAYTQFATENNSSTVEYMLYDADGRWVALHSGAAVGVYESREAALNAMALDSNTLLTDIGNDKLWVCTIPTATIRTFSEEYSNIIWMTGQAFSINGFNEDTRYFVSKELIDIKAGTKIINPDASTYYIVHALYGSDGKVIGNLDYNNFEELTIAEDTKIRIAIKFTDNRAMTDEDKEDILSKFTVSVENSEGKLKCSFLGDSITEGINTTKTYHEYLEELCDIEAKNYGANGSCISTYILDESLHYYCMVERVETVDKDSDVVFVFGGTNDFNRGCPMGTFESKDKNTSKGALAVMLQYLKDYFPNKKIYLMTPIRRGTFASQPTDLQANSAGLYLTDYVNAIKEAGELFDIEVIDLHTLTGLNPNEKECADQYFHNSGSIDNLHPNANGHLVIAQTIKEYLDGTLGNTDNDEGYISYDEAVTELRAGLVARQSSVEVKVVSDVQLNQNDCIELYSRAIAHTGVPNEGDYIRYNTSGRAYAMEETVADGKYYYDFSYTPMWLSTAEQEAEVDAAVAQIMDELNLWDADEYEKIVGVYNWVTENVDYDLDNLDDAGYMLKHSTYSAVIDRVTVCQGFASLLYRMMLTVGVDCRLITGTADYESHGWNIVKLGDVYYNVDATWDRSLMGHYRYFLIPQDNFSTHVRNSEYDTAKFHEQYPMAKIPYVQNVTASGNVNGRIQWVLDGDTGTLSVVGTGAIPSYRFSKAPWYQYRESVKSIVVGEGITEVGERAFYWCTNCTSVTLPESLTAVREYGFNNLRALQQITLPGNLKIIEFCAFSECSALKSITIPDSVTTIGSNAFSNCPSLKTATLGKGMGYIPDSMFGSDTNLTTVIFQEGLTKICDTAFMFTGLTAVELPASVTEIGVGAFSGCTKLKSITVAEGSKHFKDIDGVLFTADGKTLLSYPSGRYGSYTIPEGTEYFDYSAFRSARGLSGITFPSTLKEIGEYAFMDCTYIRSVTIPANVTRIGENAFRGCASLTNVTFQNDSVVLDYGAFSDCDNLSNITLPAKLKAIPGGLFFDCGRLTGVTIPDTVTSIGTSAFMNCDSMTSITIPGSVKKIEQQAFDNCNRLASITILEGVQRLEWIAIRENPVLRTVNIPSSVTYIHDDCFSGCPNIRIAVNCGSYGCNYVQRKGLAYSLTHSYTETVKEPTCAEGGFTTYTCPACGDAYTGDYVAALGHYVLRPGVEYLDPYTLHNSTTYPFVISNGWYASTNKSNNSSSTFRIDADYDCTMVLKYKVSSEQNYDRLEILVNGNTEVTVSGEVSERAITLNLKTGDVVSITYSKDSSVSNGADTGYFKIGSCTLIEVEGLVRIPAEMVEPTCTEAVICESCNATIKEALGHTWDAGTVTKEPTEDAEGTKLFNCERCEETKEETLPKLDHVHAYTSVVTEPTCTERGYTTHTCSCGDSYVDTYVDALGHAMGEWIVIEEATCTEDGEKRRDCSRCDYFETEVIEATGHNYEVVVTAPTCTEKGYTTHTCKCGDSFVDSYVDTLGHDMGDWIVTEEATCTEDGSKRRDCSRCDYFETEVIEAAGHNYEAVVTAPTCTDQGYTTHTCSCGDSYLDTYLDALGHDMGEWIIIEEATCTEAGEKRKDCSRCDHFETEAIEATGHNYEATVTAPTCTEQGYTTHTCKCGDSYVDTYVDALDHNMGEWIVTEEATCTVNGSKSRECSRCDHFETEVIEASGHKYESVVTAPTCTKKGYTTHTCKCGDSFVDTYVEALGHDMGEGVVTKEATCTEDGEKRRDCSRCDHFETEVIEATGHNYEVVVTEPTCTEQGYTTHTCKCGDSFVDTYVDALDHKWDAGVVTKEPTEEAIGTKQFTCERCGEIKEETLPKLDHTHKYESVVTEPTCTEQGYTTHTCSCGDSYVDTFVDALGHDMGEWAVTKEATCTEDGGKRRDCSRCDYFETEDIEAAGHNYEVVVTAPTCTEQGYTTHTCHCGDSYVDSYVDALGHKWDDGVITKEPTEDEEGTKVFTCERCGETREETLPKLDHVHAYTSVVTDPTCTEKGYTTHTCKCGDSFVDTYVDALDHKWDAGVVTKEPTEEATGTKQFTCERCGEIKEETLPKLDHTHKYESVVTEPTCTEQGYTTHSCHCGDSYVDTYVEALGHDMGEWETVKEATCTEDGSKCRDCSRCDRFETEVIEAIGHNYEATVTAPTCTEQGYTTHTCKCGENYVDSYVDALDHKWDDGVVTKEPTEEETGTKVFTCERCGETREETLPKLDHVHEYNSVVTEPTCTEKGYTTHTCSCGDSFVDSYVDPLPLPEAEVAVARMILGNELAMQFAFPKDKIVEGVDYVVSVTKTYADGREDKNILVPQSEWKTSGSYYYVSFNGIAAKEMGDTINVQILTADGVTVGDVYTDSVQNYAIRQLQKTTDAKTRTLYVDMLNYGAAAQTYFKYDAENLVTDELTPEEKAYGTKEVKLENNLVKGPGYGASQLNLASSIQLRVKFNGIDSSMYAIVKFTNHMGREIEARIEGSEFMYSGTVVVIDDVVAADYDRDVTITVYDASGKAVASAVESVASYIARMSGGAEIYSAVAKYCAAAYGYLHK